MVAPQYNPSRRHQRHDDDHLNSNYSNLQAGAVGRAHSPLLRPHLIPPPPANPQTPLRVQGWRCQGRPSFTAALPSPHSPHPRPWARVVAGWHHQGGLPAVIRCSALVPPPHPHPPAHCCLYCVYRLALSRGRQLSPFPPQPPASPANLKPPPPQLCPEPQTSTPRLCGTCRLAPLQ